MSVSSVVRKHPAITSVVILSFFGVLALSASMFTQGTFVDDNGCSYTPLNNPSGGNFTSTDQVEDFFEENNREMPSDLLLEERDGVVYHTVEGECGTVGGGN